MILETVFVVSAAWGSQFISGKNQENSPKEGRVEKPLEQERSKLLNLLLEEVFENSKG